MTVFRRWLYRAVVMMLVTLLMKDAFAAADLVATKTVAIVGCLHCRPEKDACNQVMRQIRQTDPAAVIFLGKMVESSGETLDRSLRQLRQDLGVPVYTLNQDCPFVSLPELVKMKKAKKSQAGSRQRPQRAYTEESFTFTIDTTLFIWISMDLFSGEKGDEISDTEVSFIKKSLQEAGSFRNCIVLMDGSPWFSRKESLWFDRIHPLLKGKVSAVVGAGSHTFYTKEWDGITYITTGYPLHEDYQTDRSSPHFLSVSLRERKTQFYVVPVSQKIPIQRFLGNLPIADAPDRAFEGPLKGPVIERDKADEELLLRMLALKPGMTVVDVGAGVGTVSFLFADVLKETGKVYATEVDPAMITAMNKTIQAERYKNVEPVLVTTQGLDPFYKQHEFDLVFLKNVYDLIPDPEVFFRDLRPSLKPDTGRLVIISFKRVRHFTEGDFTEINNIIRILNREGEEFPVFSRLRDETKDAVRKYTGGDLSERSLRLFIEDFNRMLDDPRLVRDLISYLSTDKYKAKISPVPLLNILDEKFLPLVNWLISELDEIGLFDRGSKAQFLLDQERVQKLNFILLKNIFEKHLYTLLYDDSRAYVQAVPYFPGRTSIVRTLERAGYTFVAERPFHPYSYFLEFKR